MNPEKYKDASKEELLAELLRRDRELAQAKYERNQAYDRGWQAHERLIS